MAEQRLIDANAAKKSLLSYYSFVNENTSKSNYTGETLMSYEVADMIQDCIENATTIDPETLPIVRQLRNELARVTEKSDATKRRWIPCSERLPEPGKSVLVWCPEYKNTYCAYHRNGTWFIFCDSYVLVNERVDCWIPVPRPQKEE